MTRRRSTSARRRASCCSRSDERRHGQTARRREDARWRSPTATRSGGSSASSSRRTGPACSATAARASSPTKPPELNQGCCSLGAHFGDGPAGEAEAMTVSAYAAMIPPEHFQFHDIATDAGVDDPASGANGIFGDAERTHTRVVEHDGTTRASSSTGPGSPAARGARCTSPRSTPATHRPSGSRRCAGSSRCGSTGRRSTTTPSRRPYAGGAAPTGATTARTMAWCCTERCGRRRGLRRRHAGRRVDA